MELSFAHSHIKAKLYQWEFEHLSDLLNPTCPPNFFGLSPVVENPLNYFILLTNLTMRQRAFMLVRFKIFPSAMHFGHFSKIPKDKRLRLFCHLLPNTLDHILFRCPAHHFHHKLFLDHWLIPFSDHFPDLLPIFLSDCCAPLTEAVANYLSEILKLTVAL